MSTTSTYTVKGMTCGHCVAAVTQAVREVAGAEDVQVDLAAGTLTVVAAAPLDTDQVAAAVDDAGFELVR